LCLKTVCCAVAAVAAGGAGDKPTVDVVAVGGAGCPHCGGCCGEGQGYDDLLHISSPSLNAGWCGVNKASDVSPSGLIIEDTILEGLLCVEKVWPLLLSPADGGIQMATLGGKLQVVLKMDGQ
jgi:hypothetical protein